jgi:hypothetical protein
MSNTKPSYEEAVIAQISTTPKLVSEIIADLREQGWRGQAEHNVKAIVREFGGHIRSRPHGAGVAIYAASVPFTEIVDFRGKTHSVQ